MNKRTIEDVVEEVKRDIRSRFPEETKLVELAKEDGGITRGLYDRFRKKGISGENVALIIWAASGVTKKELFGESPRTQQ